jgi:hypothetical protein
VRADELGPGCEQAGVEEVCEADAASVGSRAVSRSVVDARGGLGAACELGAAEARLPGGEQVGRGPSGKAQQPPRDLRLVAARTM